MPSWTPFAADEGSYWLSLRSDDELFEELHARIGRISDRTRGKVVSLTVDVRDTRPQRHILTSNGQTSRDLPHADALGAQNGLSGGSTGAIGSKQRLVGHPIEDEELNLFCNGLPTVDLQP